MQKYCKGELLDCGCGAVPYYANYVFLVNEVYCIDWSDREGVVQHLDEVIDLNVDFTLKKDDFDTVLITDVIAHVSRPELLIQRLSKHMNKDAHLILTSPFVYWISEYPHEYFHPTETAFRWMCKEAGLDIVHLEPFGGHADVLLDTLNKMMTSRWSNFMFRMLASVVKKTSWYKKRNEKSRYSYPLGYTLVARKL